MKRRYRVAFICEKLYYVEEWRFRYAVCRKTSWTKKWIKWNSPVLETRSRHMAQRVAKALNLREAFPATFRKWGVR